MALWDQVMTRLALEPSYAKTTMLHAVEKVETRDISATSGLDLGSATLSELLLKAQGLTVRPWRAASVREAMGTPAIFRAVSLIANTTGSLAVETFRNGVRLPDDQSPRVVKRPDPFRTPRAFYRDSAYHLATRGECWWWVAKRDIDDQALSLIVIPPWEITVSIDSRDRLRPTIKWLDTEMNRDDLRLITFMPDERSPAGPFQRGVGPLQLCGAALSVAVESTEWAANYFAGGGRPPLIIKSASELGMGADADAEEEASILRDQWMDQDPNTPRVIDPGIEEIQFPPDNSQGGQMLDARNNENGNAARMFGIPGSLLEYQQSGGSLHYQNDLTEFIKFVKVCLAPGYLEPVEQELSDLLTRSTVARFNVKGFLRADAKTRAEVYNLLVPLGIITTDEARMEEGYGPGDIEFAPVPFAPPQAIPDSLPIQRAASQGDAISDWRCSECGRKIAESAGPGTTIRCRHCKTVNTVPFIETRAEPAITPAPIIIQPAAPVVNVSSPQAPPVTSPVTFEPGAIQVHAHFPAQGKTVKHIERDDARNIIRIVEEESDGVVAERHIS
jgi:HK97 family phage portal protein